MPPPSAPVTRVVELPLDILSLIVAECDQTTLKRIRLCCKWLDQEATRYLFAIISFEPRTVDMERVVRIANSNNKIAGAVKSLKLKKIPKLKDPGIKNFQD